MRLAAAIGLLLLSGLAVATTRSWGAFDRGVLVAHLVIGALVVPPALRGLHRHLRRRLPHLRARTALALLAILVCGFLLPSMPVGAIAPGLAAAVNVTLVVCGGVVWRGTRGWIGAVRWERPLVLEVVHLLLWTLAAITGPLLVALGGGRAAAPLFRVHSFFGLVMVVVGAGWCVGVVRRSRSRAAWGSLCAAAVVAAGLVARGSLDPGGTPIVVHLSVAPWATRPEAERDPRPQPFDPAALSITRSCGGGDGETGCHAGIVADHLRSSHARSLEAPHVERNLAQLVAETGDPLDTHACSGCHALRELGDPARGAPAPGAARGVREGLSCIECHAIQAVELPEGDRARSTLHLVLDAASLAPFVRAERANGVLDATSRRLLALDPAAHGRAFAPRLLRQEALCQACHRAQIEPSAEAPSCNVCHMPPRAELGLVSAEMPEGVARSHLFPGTNVMLPTLLGDAETARLVREWMTSERFADELPFRAYGDDPVAPPPSDERLRSFFYLHLDVHAEASPAPGQRFRFDVRARNTFVAHGFPAGPMDLNESWLEVRVTDAAGRTLLASGGLDAGHHLLPGTRTYGGHALDAHGRPVEDYRVWTQVHEVIDRQLGLGEVGIDAFELDVPPDAAGWLTIDARWMHRELTQRFVDRSYGLDERGGPRVTTPAVEVARAFWQRRLTAGAP